MSIPPTNNVPSIPSPNTITVRVGTGLGQVEFVVDSARLRSRSAYFDNTIRSSEPSPQQRAAGVFMAAIILSEEDPETFKYYFEAVTHNRIDDAPFVALTMEDRKELLVKILALTISLEDEISYRAVVALGFRFGF